MSWIDKFLTAGLQSAAIAGIALPAPPSGLLNFVSGVTGAINATTGNLDLTIVTPTTRASTASFSCSVAGGITSVLSTGATLTDLTGGGAGQLVTVTIQSAGAKVARGGSAGTCFLLSGSADVVAADAYATVDLVYEPGAGSAGAWVERCRSTANG